MKKRTIKYDKKIKKILCLIGLVAFLYGCATNVLASDENNTQKAKVLLTFPASFQSDKEHENQHYQSLFESYFLQSDASSKLSKMKDFSFTTYDGQQCMEIRKSYHLSEYRTTKKIEYDACYKVSSEEVSVNFNKNNTSCVGEKNDDICTNFYNIISDFNNDLTNNFIHYVNNEKIAAEQYKLLSGKLSLVYDLSGFPVEQRNKISAYLNDLVMSSDFLLDNVLDVSIYTVKYSSEHKKYRATSHKIFVTNT